MLRPYLIQLSKLGTPDIGYITVVEGTTQIPFPIARTFWTYHTPESIVRGRHAHHITQQVIVAVAGRIIVNTETPSAEIQTFVLDAPHVGVYVPPNVWHSMQYSQDAIQLVFASTPYEEADYIWKYEEFRSKGKG